MGFEPCAGSTTTAPSVPPDPRLIAAVKQRLGLIEEAIAILATTEPEEPAPMLGEPTEDRAPTRDRQRAWSRAMSPQDLGAMLRKHYEGSR